MRRKGKNANAVSQPFLGESLPNHFCSLRAATQRARDTKEIGSSHHQIVINIASNMSVVMPSRGSHSHPADNNGHSDCPLCNLNDASVEHAGNIPSDNQTIRQIMGQELLSFGNLPDNLVYARIARAYNTRVHRPTTIAGFHSEKWTGRMVKVHFEKHVRLVPRRIVSKDMMRCEKYLQIIEREINAGVATSDDPTDLLDQKTLNKAILVMKMKQSLLKDLRGYVKEDLVVTGCDIINKQVGSGNLDGEDARDILTTMHASANGVGPSGVHVFAAAPRAGDDLPVGEEVFA